MEAPAPHPALQPAAVFTVALGEEMLRLARFSRATFKASHPEIPFHIVDDSFFNWFIRDAVLIKRGEIMSMRAVIGWWLARFYRRVVYLDADTLVFGPVPALLDPSDPLTVTSDVDFSYGAGEPRLNAGVMAATGREPWRIWMREIFSQVVPATISFIDQLALREIVGRGAVPARIWPERERREYYNLSVILHPGELSVREGTAFKGDAEIRVFHYAGNQFERDWRKLPKPLSALAAARAAAGRAFADYQAENGPLREALRRCEEDYLVEMWEFFRGIPTVIRDIDIGFPRSHPGIFLSDAPAPWDQFRDLEGTGVYRRVFGDPHRIVYAREPGRLEEADAAEVWIENWGGRGSI